MKIRIAVAVAEDGEWHSFGWGRPEEKVTDEDIMRWAVESIRSAPSANYFIEADIPIPKPKTIKGVVEEKP